MTSESALSPRDFALQVSSSSSWAILFHFILSWFFSVAIQSDILRCDSSFAFDVIFFGISNVCNGIKIVFFSMKIIKINFYLWGKLHKSIIKYRILVGWLNGKMLRKFFCINSVIKEKNESFTIVVFFLFSLFCSAFPFATQYIQWQMNIIFFVFSAIVLLLLLSNDI